MDNLLQSSPIQRQLFRNASEFESRGNSGLISFSRSRPRGRYLLVTVIIVGTVLLLSLSGQAGI
jgi:hypothetical protein